MGRPPRDIPVRAAAFGDHPLVIVSARPSAGQQAPHFQKHVANEHFLVRERGSGTRNAFECFLSDIPDRIDHPGTEIDSNETIKQAVIAGLGVAFISATLSPGNWRLGG